MNARNAYALGVSVCVVSVRSVTDGVATGYNNLGTSYLAMNDLTTAAFYFNVCAVTAIGTRDITDM